MKALTSFFLSVVLLGSLSLAQTPQTQTPAASPANPQVRRGGWRAQGMQRMLQRLNLTDAQKSQLQPMLQQHRQEMQALRNDQSLTPDQRRAKAQELNKSFRSQMEGVLTPEQQQQLRNARRKGAMARLNLTDQQKAQLKPIMQQQRQQVQAVRSDTTLSQQQKQEKIRDIRQNTMSQMQSVLTPEQLQQLQQMRRGGRRGRGAGAGPSGSGSLGI